MEKGLIYVFTGGGKGKTSAALGVTVRGLLLGWRVCWISFYKEETWEISEKKLVDKFDNLEMHWVGEGFYIPDGQEKAGVKVADVAGGKVVDKVDLAAHKQAAKEGVKLAEQKLQSGKYELVVLDEVNNAIADRLVEASEVVDLLKSRGSTHVVLTGRDVNKTLVEMADLVTNCEKVKHPYDKGKVAVKGLDF